MLVYMATTLSLLWGGAGWRACAKFLAVMWICAAFSKHSARSYLTRQNGARESRTTPAARLIVLSIVRYSSTQHLAAGRLGCSGAASLWREQYRVCRVRIARTATGAWAPFTYTVGVEAGSSGLWRTAWRRPDKSHYYRAMFCHNCCHHLVDHCKDHHSFANSWGSNRRRFLRQMRRHCTPQ